MTGGAIHTVRSKDGTPIAYWRSGAGSPLVLVHGTSADHTRWAPVLPGLEQHFAVYALDRRGRGGSGDADDYSIEREFEDVAAVVAAIGERVNLLGHSFGGLCALECAMRSHSVRRLVLYEPPFGPLGDGVVQPEILELMRAQLAAGNRDAVVTTMMRDIVKVPPHELDLLRSAPAWQGRVAAAHTILRELPVENAGYQLDTMRLRAMQIPTLLLQGSDSPSFLKRATASLHALLAKSQIVVMPGQQHTAMNTAPELFVREVVTFLTASL